MKPEWSRKLAQAKARALAGGESYRVTMATVLEGERYDDEQSAPRNVQDFVSKYSDSGIAESSAAPFAFLMEVGKGPGYWSPHYGRPGEVGGSAPRLEDGSAKASIKTILARTPCALVIEGPKVLTEQEAKGVAGALEGFVAQVGVDQLPSGITISANGGSGYARDTKLVYVDTRELADRQPMEPDTLSAYIRRSEEEKAALEKQLARTKSSTTRRAVAEKLRDVGDRLTWLKSTAPTHMSLAVPERLRVTALLLHELGHHCAPTVEGLGVRSNGELVMEQYDARTKSRTSEVLAIPPLSRRAFDNASEYYAEAFVAAALGRWDSLPDALVRKYRERGFWQGGNLAALMEVGQGPGYWSPHAGRPGEVGGSAPRGGATKDVAGSAKTPSWASDEYSERPWKWSLDELGVYGLENFDSLPQDQQRIVLETLHDIKQQCDLPTLKELCFADGEGSHYSPGDNSITIDMWQVNNAFTDKQMQQRVELLKKEIQTTDIWSDEQIQTFKQSLESLSKTIEQTGLIEHSMYWFSEKDRLRAAIIHEFGHHYHRRSLWGKSFWGEETPRFQAAVTLTARAKDNYTEYVAEAFVAHYLGKDDLITPWVLKAFEQDGIWKKPTTVSEFVGMVREEGTMTDMIIREPVCFTCKHLVYWPLCEAFLGEIPMDIRNGENVHDKPVEGDHGIQYERYVKEKPVKEAYTILDLVNEVKGAQG